MPKSTIELQARNQRGKNRENRLQNIHILTENIKKESYFNIRFFDFYNKENVTQEQLLDYCDLLYKFSLQHNELEVIVKDKSFLKTDSVISLVAFLEDTILSSYLKIINIDIEDKIVTLGTSVDAFNSYQVFDVNVGYVDFKMDVNLKTGITHCVSKFHNGEGDGLFDYFEVDVITREFYDDDEEELGDYTKKELKVFDKTRCKYQDKFDNYLRKKYHPDKKYTDPEDIHLAKIINEILSYDAGSMYDNIEELGDGEAPFYSVFIPTLRNINDITESIFEEALETRCRSLGETGIEYISQYIYVTENAIENHFSEEQIKEIQKYENNISDLCHLTNNYKKNVNEESA